MKLVVIKDGIPVTTSEVIAANTDNQHKNVLELVNQYKEQIEAFGTFAFETRKSGGRPTEIAILNEPQATFLLTLMRNSDIVVKFKLAMVKEFFDMRTRLIGRQQRESNSDAKQTGLDRLRTAQAIRLAEETAARICARFSKLGESAQQSIYAKLVNPIAGDEVLSLPRVFEQLKTAGQVGTILGVSGNKIGRLANKLGMKTAEYGEFRLDKSEYSVKQVETFYYNQQAVELLREALLSEPNLEVVV